MGGIVGIQFLRNLGSIDKQRVVQQMLDEISHRATFSGVYRLEEDSALGIRYHTPADQTRIFAHDGSKKLYVVMDGEIFDGFERSKLNKAGFSDAEIVLELYREKGTEFLNQIDGSFAIAIWDGVEKKLLLARDRVGFKPLFYAKSDGLFFSGRKSSRFLLQNFVRDLLTSKR